MKSAVFIFFSVGTIFGQLQAPESLRFVEIWFRHGERMSTHFVTFPIDANDETSQISQLGQKSELTNKGIKQEFELGTRLKSYYSPFLGDKYIPSELHMWTGKDNRTVTSTLSLCAGLFPPIEEQIWNPSLLWQPVAVHTDDTLDWVSTGIEHECPPYEKTVFEASEFAKVLDIVDPKFLNFLETRSEVKINSVIDFNHVFDTLLSIHEINDSRLPMPEWGKQLDYVKLRKLHTQLHYRVLTIQNDTVNAYHAEAVLSYIEDHLQRKSTAKNKAVFLAGHDTSLLSIGMAFGIEELQEKLADFASYLSVELHFLENEYFVQFWFCDGSLGSRQLISPRFCPGKCSLNNLQNVVMANRLPRKEFISICKGIQYVDKETTGIVTGSLIVLIGILLLSTLILGATTYSYRKQLRKHEPERQALLLN